MSQTCSLRHISSVKNNPKIHITKFLLFIELLFKQEMTPRQNSILQEVLLLAHDSVKFAKAKIAAAVVKNNKIIAFGFNQNKTHTLQARFSKRYQAVFIHAEIDAIKNALRKISVEDLSKCDIYIARSRYVPGEKKEMISGLAKPCIGCQRAIVTFGFRNVFYTE